MKKDIVASRMAKQDNALLQFCYRELKDKKIEPSPRILLAMWAAFLRGRGEVLDRLVKNAERGKI